MLKDNCVFCSILKGSIPSYKIYEDSKYLAILDIFPNMPGQTVIITKNHDYEYAFAMPDRELSDLMLFSKKIANFLDNAMKCYKTALVIEGMMVQHVHVKLYPLIGTRPGMILESGEVQKFHRYEGYITTKVGPMASKEEMEYNLRTIRDANNL
jgi:diadenosine tetraphosphate (Ap4A) HIT family hydrolase